MAGVNKNKGVDVDSHYIDAMPYCFAPACGHDSRRDLCRFYRFPKDPKQHKKWTNVCGRGDRDPGSEDRLCSCHFLDKKKENGPSIFALKEDKLTNFPSPKPTRIRRGKRIKKDMPVTSCYHLCRVVSDDESTLSCTEDLPENEVSCTASTSTTQNNREIKSEAELLKAEICLLKKENRSLRENLSLVQNRMSVQSIRKTNDLVLHYTGLPTFAEFNILSTMLNGFKLSYFSGEKVDILPHEDQLLCALMKLRLNLTFIDLGFRFQASESTILDICITYIYAIHKVLFKNLMSTIRSQKASAPPVPSCFASFNSCRIVIDSMEVEMGIPTSTKDQKFVSHFKQRSTCKVLVGIAPNGTITYISDLYPGSSSDNFIAESCGFVYRLQAGDLVLAGKGFQIKDFLSQHNVSLLTATLSDPQFKDQEVMFAYRIAEARMHAENVMKNIKAYEILDYIPPDMKTHASVIVQVCGALFNFQYTLGNEK